MNRTLLSGLASALLFTPALGPNVVQVTPSKDNTLYETDVGGDASNAVGPQFFAGRVGGFGGQVGLRRGLIAFDVASSVPAGATIDSVTLTVWCSRVPILDNGNARQHDLHRATANWGEGTSDAGIGGGAGAAPTAGDATWVDAFFPSTPWTSLGGDFVGAFSSSISVPSTGSYVFASTPQLVADVQDMLDNPAGNFGWVVRGDEVTSGVARGFDSREGPAYPLYNGTAPVLEIHFTPGSVNVPALTSWGKLALAGLLLGAGVLLVSRRSAA